MNNKTPATDSRLIPDVKHSNDDGDSVYSDCVPADFTRTLERERDEALRQRDEARQETPEGDCPPTNCSAFPIRNEYYPNGEVEYGQGGMTLRDYFAAKVLQAIIAHPQGKAGKWAEASKDAYDAADAMLISRQNAQFKS